jgi:Cu+-exporting ATPase
MQRGGCGHSTHDRHNTEEHHAGGASIEKKVRDPVCGMEIEIGRAARSTKYGPNAYYFCSKDCYWKFKERPQYFVEILDMEKRYIA